MKKLLLFLAMFTMLFSSSVAAHVSNEKTIFDDIEFSEAKEEIVYLCGLNAITREKGIFEPQAKFTKADLALWAAKFKGLGQHGDAGQHSDAGAGTASEPSLTKEELQQAAVEKGLVDSLKGNATYADVNKAYFDGKAAVEKPEAELTREEFALFMGRFFKEKVDGKTLFDIAGFEQGPAGLVEKVTSKMEGEGEKAYKVFRLTIGGREYEVSKHPMILHGPVDLSALEGKKIAESWLAGEHGKEKTMQITAMDKAQFTDAEIVGKKPNHDGNQSTSAEVTAQQKPAGTAEQPKKAFPIVPVAGGVVLVGVAAWLFMKKK